MPATTLIAVQKAIRNSFDGDMLMQLGKDGSRELGSGGVTVSYA